MEPESVLLEGILALQRGERERAGALLVKYTRTNPQSAEGWLWLSRCLDDAKEIEYCLGKARKIDPALADSFLNEQSKAVAAKEGGAGETAMAVPSPTGGFRLTALSKRGRRAAWIGLVVVVLLAAAGGWWMYRQVQAERARLAPLVSQARPLVQDCGETCDYAQAADLLDRVLKSDPNQMESRYLRAVAMLNLAGTQYDPEQSLEALNRARVDIDRFIAASRAPDGREYILRSQIYHALAMRQGLRVDAEQLLRTALENLAVARQLGDTSTAQQDMPLLFIQLGKCDEAIEELERQQDEASQDGEAAVLLEGEALWQIACENNLSGALDTLNRSLETDPQDLQLHTVRMFERALILYMNGEVEAALVDLDDQIIENPEGAGERYFLRALILYEQGYGDLAEEDRLAGEANTWERNGLDAYVRALMALDGGQEEEALRLLQQAEASTLPGIYSPMLERYRADLADLSGAPLAQTPAAEYRVTPISIEQ